jgi:hypothetical protein
MTYNEAAFFWIIIGAIIFGIFGRVPKKKKLQTRITSTDIQTSEKDLQKIGRDFEEFIITRFDKKKYSLLEWPGDKFIKGWGGAIANQRPDIVMKSLESGKIIAIECKYLSNPDTRDGFLKWAPPQKINRYREYERTSGNRVFIAIGIGGKPYDPHTLFLPKLREIDSPIRISDLLKYEIPAHPSGLEIHCE